MSKKMAAGAAECYTEKQVEAVQGLIDDAKLAPYVKLQRIVKHCKDEGIARIVDGLTADLFLIHSDNRGSLMLDLQDAPERCQHQEGGSQPSPPLRVRMFRGVAHSQEAGGAIRSQP